MNWFRYRLTIEDPSIRFTTRLPFLENGPKLGVPMQRLKRILGPLVISLSLYAVWPAVDYDSRLQLFNEVVDAAQAPPATQTNKVACCIDLFGLNTGSPRLRRYWHANSNDPDVQAIIPINQGVGPPVVLATLNHDFLALDLYRSGSCLRPSGRAPPAQFSFRKNP